MTQDQETLRRIDDAVAHFERALKAVREIPTQGGLGLEVNGIEHELMALVERLRSLRDEVAGEGADREE